MYSINSEEGDFLFYDFKIQSNSKILIRLHIDLLNVFSDNFFVTSVKKNRYKTYTYITVRKFSYISYSPTLLESL